MFSQLVSVVSSPDLRAFLDVLCKGTSGAAASDISAAYMVRAFAEMYQPGGYGTAAVASVAWWCGVCCGLYVWRAVVDQALIFLL